MARLVRLLMCIVVLSVATITSANDKVLVEIVSKQPDNVFVNADNEYNAHVTLYIEHEDGSYTRKTHLPHAILSFSKLIYSIHLF